MADILNVQLSSNLRVKKLLNGRSGIFIHCYPLWQNVRTSSSNKKRSGRISFTFYLSYYINHLNSYLQKEVKI